MKKKMEEKVVASRIPGPTHLKFKRVIKIGILKLRKCVLLKNMTSIIYSLL